MTEKMQQILDKLHYYNMENMAAREFGIDPAVVYDALVIVPSYSPDKIIHDDRFMITELPSGGACRSFIVERDGLKIAWIKTAVGACNILDYLMVCGELKFKKLIFTGSVGALKEGYELGDLCIPTYSISGTFANAYLKEKLSDFVPFEKVYPDTDFAEQVKALAKSSEYEIKEAPVFCTDSVVMEYSHLDEIKTMGAELIEMETATFYEIARIMQIPAIALLVVSDNSATGVPLVGRNEEMQQKYDRTKHEVLPDMIYKIALL